MRLAKRASSASCSDSLPNPDPRLTDCAGLSRLSPRTSQRNRFDGLHALVRDHLQLDAFAGHLYLFANKRRDRLKLLYWDRSGFAIWAKRLEAGTFAIPSGEPDAKRFEITVEELGALLSGINLEQANRRKRFQRSVA